MRGLMRFIFWDFPRASWQYDVMVALILIFIFATPADFFKDRLNPQNVWAMSDGQFWIASELLKNIPEDARIARATELVNKKFNTHKTIIKVETLHGGDEDIQGFLAVPKP
jgi:hypothetical protein